MEQSNVLEALYVVLIPNFDKAEKLQSFEIKLNNNTLFEMDLDVSIANSEDSLMSIQDKLSINSNMTLMQLDFSDLDSGIKFLCNLNVQFGQDDKQELASIATLNFTKEVKLGPKILQTKMVSIDENDVFIKVLITQADILMKIEKAKKPKEIPDNDQENETVVTNEDEHKAEFENVLLPKNNFPSGVPLVIDLHAEKLIPDMNSMTPGEIMDIQLSQAQKSIDEALAKGYSELVLIHGVGTGILRDKLFALLKKNNHVEYFENSYDLQYGFGATGVFLK